MYKKLLILLMFSFIGWSATPVLATSPSVADMLEGNQQDSNQENDSNQNTEQVEEGSVTNTEQYETTNLFLDLIKLVFALTFVIGLIYFLLKFLNRKNKVLQKGKTLENLGGISLGASKSIQLVRIGTRVYVVGVGENVELLSEIIDDETIEELMSEVGQEDWKASSLIQSLINKKKEQPKQPNEEMGQFSGVFKSEMNKLIDGRKRLTDRLTKKDDHHE